VLIVVSLKWSNATYFDLGEKPKDYTNIKRVLDHALIGYKMMAGPIKREKKQQGLNVFTHVASFPCAKKPRGSAKEAYYVLHHMRGFIREQEHLTLPASLKPWAEKLASIEDRDLRREFYRIQDMFLQTIEHDVCTEGGIFYYSNALPPNEEIQARLDAH
jgi:hypothetical protein